MFASVRRTGRIFALLLLVWTAVDLVDHSLCGRGEGGPEAGTVALVGQPSPGHASQPSHIDHSFCCSHTVDVQTPFRIALTFDAVGLQPLEAPALPLASPDDLYHPPLV
jgi:hypothetical protein